MFVKRKIRQSDFNWYDVMAVCCSKAGNLEDLGKIIYSLRTYLRSTHTASGGKGMSA